MSFFFGTSALTDTGANGVMSPASELYSPTKGTEVPVPAKHPQLLQQRPTRPPTDLRPLRQQPNRHPCSMMRATSGRMTTGKPSFQSPRRKSARGGHTYGKLGLKPPDFSIPEVDGGPHHKINPILKTVGHVESVLEGRWGPGVTAGLTCATTGRCSFFIRQRWHRGSRICLRIRGGWKRPRRRPEPTPLM